MPVRYFEKEILSRQRSSVGCSCDETWQASVPGSLWALPPCQIQSHGPGRACDGGSSQSRHARLRCCKNQSCRGRVLLAIGSSTCPWIVAGSCRLCRRLRAVERLSPRTWRPGIPTARRDAADEASARCGICKSSVLVGAQVFKRGFRNRGSRFTRTAETCSTF